MLRFFGFKPYFDKQTVKKVLLAMKDFYRDSRANRLHLDSNDISEETFFVKALQNAMEKVISAARYQQLPQQQKDQFIQCIAKTLYYECDKHLTNSTRDFFDEPDWRDKVSTKKVRGISFSTVDDDLPYKLEYAIEVNFPKTLFSNGISLRNCLYAACYGVCPDLLKERENPTLSMAYRP